MQRPARCRAAERCQERAIQRSANLLSIVHRWRDRPASDADWKRWRRFGRHITICVGSLAGRHVIVTDDRLRFGLPLLPMSEPSTTKQVIRDGDTALFVSSNDWTRLEHIVPGRCELRHGHARGHRSPISSPRRGTAERRASGARTSISAPLSDNCTEACSRSGVVVRSLCLTARWCQRRTTAVRRPLARDACSRSLPLPSRGKSLAALAPQSRTWA